MLKLFARGNPHFSQSAREMGHTAGPSRLLPDTRSCGENSPLRPRALQSCKGSFDSAAASRSAKQRLRSG
jgi:hypothetical protein